MRRHAAMLVVCGGLIAAPAEAQTNVELWGNVTPNWLKSDRLTYELDFEREVLGCLLANRSCCSSTGTTTPNRRYIRTRSRDTIGEGFTTSENSLDLRLKRVF